MKKEDNKSIKDKNNIFNNKEIIVLYNNNFLLFGYTLPKTQRKIKKNKRKGNKTT